MKQLRERLQTYGASTLSSAELLAYLLASHGGRAGSDPLTAACQLLDRYNLKELAELAAMDAVCLVDAGLSKTQVQRLRAVGELARRLGHPAPCDYPCIRSPADAAAILQPLLMLLDHEELWVLVLDSRHHVLATVQTYVGTVNSSVLRAAELFRQAIVRNSPAIIVCHNHPGGDPSPSPEDIATNEQLVQAGKLLDIELVDHLIIGNPGYQSLRERNRW